MYHRNTITHNILVFAESHIGDIIDVLEAAKIAAGALPVAGDIAGSVLDVALAIAKQAKVHLKSLIVAAPR